jgi:hypothetical protein
MRKTFSLLTLSLGVLFFCTAAKAQVTTYTVTFTLTCDKQASATLTPVADDPNPLDNYLATIHVADAGVQIYDCGISTMQCDGSHGGEKTVTATCTNIPFTPVAFITSFFTTVPTLGVTNKHGSNSCISAGAVPSSNDCNGLGGGGKGATLSASSPQ